MLVVAKKELELKKLRKRREEGRELVTRISKTIELTKVNERTRKEIDIIKLKFYMPPS